jgi:L-ascorbate metabolism protein UlaG (beta-lactamase superfamily)
MSVHRVKIIALLLVAFSVAAGPVVSQAQTAQMESAMQMALTTGADTSMPCHDMSADCPDMDAATCAANCAAGFTAFTTETMANLWTSSIEMVAARLAFTLDITPLLEPKPPKHSSTT